LRTRVEGFRGERRLQARVHVNEYRRRDVRGGANVGRRLGDLRQGGLRGRSVVGGRRAQAGGRLHGGHADSRSRLRHVYVASRQQLAGESVVQLRRQDRQGLRRRRAPEGSPGRLCAVSRRRRRRGRRRDEGQLQVPLRSEAGNQRQPETA